MPEGEEHLSADQVSSLVDEIGSHGMGGLTSHHSDAQEHLANCELCASRLAAAASCASSAQLGGQECLRSGPLCRTTIVGSRWLPALSPRRIRFIAESRCELHPLLVRCARPPKTSVPRYHPKRKQPSPGFPGRRGNGKVR